VFNAYETLITWNRESYYTFQPQLATSVPDRENENKTITGASVDYGATFSDGSICKGFTDLNAAPPNDGFSVGDVLYLNTTGTYRAWFVTSVVGTYTLTLRRYSYTFPIRTSPTIYFIDETGATVDTLTIDDAEFTFERGLAQDTGPQWMFYTAMFGCFNGNAWNSNDTSRKNAIDQAHLIDDAVETSGNNLTLNLGMPFPDNAFKQTLSNTWGSIGSKEWFLTKLGVGYGYNGDLYTLNSLGYPAWHNASNVWHKSRSPIDATGSLTWAGTGPYYVGVFDQPNLKIDLIRNDAYWGGWPAAGRNDSIAVYEIQYIESWDTRRELFKSGDIDVCAVPRANMFELLQTPSTNSEPILRDGKPVIKTIKNIVPSISMDALHFTFEVSNLTTGYMGSGHFPDGIPTTFFNNTHIRKAFAYSFDAAAYGVDSYYGEADYRKNPLAQGLYPDYYDDSVPGYTANQTAAEAELRLAFFPDVTPNTTNSVWDTGFKLTLVYNTGNDMRRIACEMIKNFFVDLSVISGKSFTVDLANIDWNVYLDEFYAYELPIWSIGWLADFADADNFMRPYMHSYGDFSGSQLYSVDNGWGSEKDSLLDQALMAPDDATPLGRRALYRDLAMIYYNDCPSVPITCPRGRRWCNYWVKGWYYDALYPAFYIRDYFKMDNCWYDMTGQTLALSDGICNMRDIQYLIARFNAKAPQPGVAPDTRWNGNYGANGGVDPSGDRLSNMRDIQGAILHFNHKLDTGVP
jgi:peptide/nickel transport system substrate-binding protein